MSVEYAAHLIVGLPYSEVVNVEGIDNMIDDGDIGYSSPYYDAPREDWIVGVRVMSSGDYTCKVVPPSFMRDSEAAYHKFKEMTGLEGRLHLSVHGW